MLELNKIYNEDCLEGMKRIPDKSVDMILCDPPYLHIKGGNKGWVGDRYTFKGKERFNDSFVGTNMSDFGEEQIISFLDAVKPKMKKLNIILFCSELQLQYYFKWIYDNKCKYNLMVWDKGKRVIMNRNRYMSNLEYIIRIYEKGVSCKSVLINEYYSKYKSNKVDNDKLHNTQKPISLLNEFIQLHTSEGDIIMDCFMGSGSTAVACINTSRNFIGFELDKGYYDIANERIRRIHTLSLTTNCSITKI